MATTAVPGPAPSTAAIPIARSTGGKAKNTSITRPSTWSATRPRPARSPSTPPATSATPIEAPAMPSETRTPKTMRDRRSRPNRSVPNGWRWLGPWNTWAASIAVGENGAMRPAKSPTAIMRKSATQAPTKSGPRASEPVGAVAVPGSAAAEARIEDRIEEIHGEVQHHERGGEEENHALHHGIVSLEDRVEQEAPHTGQREDVLDHDDAAHDVAELDAGDRDDGDQRVPERVVEGHPALGQPLGARRADVLAPEDGEHRRARHARDRRRRRRPQRQRRQRHRQEIGGRVARERHPLERRHPAEVDREEQNQHGPLPEGRKREAERGDHADRAVPDAAAPHGRSRAERDADQERPRHGERRQLGRDGQPLEKEGQNRPAREPGDAEVAAEDRGDPLEVLHVGGTAEPEEAAERGEHLGRRD